MAIDKSFLGRGWSFPPTFLPEDKGGLVMVSAEKDISQSLEILMGTSLGERILLPECDLLSYLFEPITVSKMNYLQELVRTAIVNYETRINLEEVLIDRSDYLDGIIKIKLEYSVPMTNTRFNLVFPYYKVEGTGIPQLYHEHVSLSKKKEVDK